MTTKQRFKMKIAKWLDKRHPEYCWARLVSWALGYYSFRDTFGRYSGDVKNQPCLREKYTYCGKCEKTGRFKKNL